MARQKNLPEETPPQGLSYEQVAAAATRLKEDGAAVTLESLVAELPGASPNALYGHLAAWRAAQPAPSPPEAALPPALLHDLAEWARQYADQAGSASRAAQQDAERDLEALRAAGQALEAEKEEANALLAERDETIARLNAELADARAVAMDALVSKAKDQLAIEGKESQLQALRAQIERNVAAQASESDARLAAQMELVGATTARDKFAAEVKDLRAQIEALRSRR